MKPPLLAALGRRCLVLLAVTMIFAGCRQGPPEPAPPAKHTKAPVTATEPAGPAIEPTAQQAPAAPAPAAAETPATEGPTTETPADSEPQEPAAPSSEPATEEPAAQEPVPPLTPPVVEEPSRSPVAPAGPAEEPPAAATETPPAETEPPAAAEETSPAATEPPAAKEEAGVAVELPDSLPEPKTPQAAAQAAGLPLGEDLAKLTSLQPKAVVWIDKKGHRVIMTGQVCQRNAPLEMFACLSGTKEHEAVVAVPTRAMFVHAALLAVGAEPGKPVQFHPTYVPASGTEVAVEVRWKGEDGKVRSSKAQDWVRNINTKKPLEFNWVFGGSNLWTDEETGQKFYSADSGDLICVSNFPSAMLDLPVESSQSDASLLFEAFTEHIPPLGTPVTIILKPRLAAKKTKEPGQKKVEQPSRTRPQP